MLINFTQGHGRDGSETMDETGVSSEEAIPAAKSSQISVNLYQNATEKADSDGHDSSQRRDERRAARYPYTSMFFLLGNTIGQR